MFWHRVLHLSFLLLAGSRGLPTDECPILGPVFPPYLDVSGTNAFREAVAAFPKIIDGLFSSGAVNQTHSTFSIDVFSAAANKSLYSYYHAGPALNGTLTAGVLDDRTIYRTGSVSKLFLTYAILAHAGMGVLEDPVTKYLPALAGNPRDKPLEAIIWEDVTIGALMSHQGGTGGAPAEIALACLGESQTNCTADYFLSIMRAKRPVFAPFETTLYSDAGYVTLGLVLAKMTGVPYAQALRRILVEPLQLNGTLTTEPLPADVNGVAIPGDATVSSWGRNNSITTPSGGVYSNPADLRRLGLSILHAELLDPATTRSWLKPRGHTASLSRSVGLVWEIERLALNISASSARTRISDLYVKMGGNPGYGAATALSPDHGLGFSVLIAGARPGARYALRDAVAASFVSAAEHGTREHGAQALTGTFAAPAAAASNGTASGGNSSSSGGSGSGGTNLTLTVDADGPGLLLKSFTVDGVDVRGNLSLPGTGPAPGDDFTVRLFPTNPAWNWPLAGAAAGAREQISFRAVTYARPLGRPPAAEGGAGLLDAACNNWAEVGFGAPWDELVLELVDGRLQSVTSIALNTLAETDVRMTRVD